MGPANKPCSAFIASYILEPLYKTGCLKLSKLGCSLLAAFCKIKSLHPRLQWGFIQSTNTVCGSRSPPPPQGKLLCRESLLAKWCLPGIYLHPTHPNVVLIRLKDFSGLQARSILPGHSLLWWINKPNAGLEFLYFPMSHYNTRLSHILPKAGEGNSHSYHIESQCEREYQALRKTKCETLLRWPRVKFSASIQFHSSLLRNPQLIGELLNRKLVMISSSSGHHILPVPEVDRKPIFSSPSQAYLYIILYDTEKSHWGRQHVTALGDQSQICVLLLNCSTEVRAAHYK